MISPTLAAQAGDGRHKLAAAASPNSLLVNLVSVPGQANNHADDTLSLCLHAHAALVLLGLTSERAFVSTFALVHSIASTTLPRVLPDVDPSPNPSSAVVRTSGTGSCSQVEDWRASCWIFSQDRLISLAMLQSETNTCRHLVSVGVPSPQHSAPPHVFES